MMADLARRAVACPRWRWMRGSTALILYREHPCADVEPERMPHVVTRDGALDLSGCAWMGIANQDPLPDLSEPATLGCLVALVREAWGLPKACVIWNADKGRAHDPEMEWAQGDDNDPDVIALLNRYSWMVKGLGQTDEWLENIESRVSPEIYQQVIRDILGHGASEAEALVNALEGAP